MVTADWSKSSYWITFDRRRLNAKRCNAKLNNWDDVLRVLQEVHVDKTAVAIYPNADI